MIQSLEQYFIQYGYLDLPGIGTIKLSNKEAIWEDGIIMAPNETILFEPIANKPSKLFYIFIADLMGISSEQSAVKFDQLIHDFSEKTVASLEIGTLGILHKQADTYTWKSYFSGEDYYHDVSIKSIDNTKTRIENSDINNTNNWVIWALVLFVVALILIFFKQI